VATEQAIVSPACPGSSFTKFHAFGTGFLVLQIFPQTLLSGKIPLSFWRPDQGLPHCPFFAFWFNITSVSVFSKSLGLDLCCLEHGPSSSYNTSLSRELVRNVGLWVLSTTSVTAFLTRSPGNIIYILKLERHWAG
jgi:hypothetical protein